MANLLPFNPYSLIPVSCTPIQDPKLLPRENSLPKLAPTPMLWGISAVLGEDSLELP